MQIFTRRSVIKAGLVCAAYGMIPAVARAYIPHASRSLQFYNTHTGESLKTTYWEQGQYIPEALKDINHVLRDHRTNETKAIDPHLLDILARLHSTLDSRSAFEVISGYRSPRSNAMLHAHSNGVAKNSMHLYGKAIDIRLSDRSLSLLHSAAQSLRQGGVGYYPTSDFVHIDTGRVRYW